MMVLPFGNMPSFMLMMLWLSATGEKMSFEKKLGNIYMLRTVPLDRLIFILVIRFSSLLFRMELKLGILSRPNMSMPQWQMLRIILLSMEFHYHAKLPLLLRWDIDLNVV